MSTQRTLRYTPSAATLAWGLGLLVVGGALAQYGQIQTLQAALDPWGGGGGEGLVLLGGAAALIGIVLTIIGVYSLATNVDIAAQIAIGQQEPAPAPDVDDEPTGEPGEIGPLPRI